MKLEKSNVGIIIHDPSKYDSLMHMLLRGKEEELREYTVSGADLKAGEKVLDIGCGTGLLALTAKKKVGEQGTVIGIDPSTEMLAHARDRATDQKLNVQFEEGAIQQLRFEDNSFDAVFCSLVMHHIPEAARDRGIQEIFRVLKPGGCVIMVEFAPPESRFKRFLWFFILGHMIFEKKEQYFDLLNRGCFSSINIEKTRWSVLILAK
nr:class I SAM-dependent methyltransferase [Candidatus Sigynarchaeota archaeon]